MSNEQCKPCSINCELIHNDYINKNVFRLVFVWSGAPPKAGQFFMIKPKRSSVFLGRPISVAAWKPAIEDDNYTAKKARGKKSAHQRYLTGKYLSSDTVTFLIARIGKGTEELASMHIGDEAELIGPLGNAWSDFLSTVENDSGKRIALISGGLGIAPLNALLCESSKRVFDLYAGFKDGFRGNDEKNALLGPAFFDAEKLVVATEDGKDGYKGFITDFLEPEKYAAVCACGPHLMLKAVAEKCNAANVACFISTEQRMACGVGACLGCTIQTVHGNRRCCADGPIFSAKEVIFND